MSHKALIERSIGQVVSLLGNDKFSLERNKVEKWAYADAIETFVHDIIDAETHLFSVNWGFATSQAASGVVYVGGFYDFGSSHNDFSPTLNFGTANGSYAAHFFVVVGATTGDELTLRITGTSITDAGVRTEDDTQDIVISNGTTANTYFETTKKWLGLITIAVISGTPIDCNYGYCKYFDHSNIDFTVTDLEVTWFSEANTSNSDLAIIHHKPTGWTYNAGASPSPPTAMARMSLDHSTERNTISGKNGAWKMSNFSELISGDNHEGIIIEIMAGAGKTFTFGNFTISFLTTI